MARFKKREERAAQAEPVVQTPAERIREMLAEGVSLRDEGRDMERAGLDLIRDAAKMAQETRAVPMSEVHRVVGKSRNALYKLLKAA
jgi:hypothetical protein